LGSFFEQVLRNLDLFDIRTIGGTMRGKRIEEALARIEARLEAMEAQGSVWREVARQSALEKKELLDRLMGARDFAELKTFGFEPEKLRETKPYNPAEDQGSAGTVVAVPK
jgi:hypothetical protein